MDKLIFLNDYGKVESLYPYDSDITDEVIVNHNTIVLESHVVGVGNDTYEYSVWDYDIVKETKSSIRINLRKLKTQWC
jgi:hypothetical protein